jgi:hypothetical protein
MTAFETEQGERPREGAAFRVTSRTPAGNDAHPSGRRARGFHATGEFAVLAAVTLAVLIAAAAADDLGAARAWTLVTILAAAYIVSRGIAKLGRHRDSDDLPG